MNIVKNLEVFWIIQYLGKSSCYSYLGNAIFTEPKDKWNLNYKMHDLSIPGAFLEETNI